MQVYHEHFTVCSSTAFEKFCVLIKDGNTTKKKTTKTLNVSKDKGEILVRGDSTDGLQHTGRFSLHRKWNYVKHAIMSQRTRYNTNAHGICEDNNVTS